MECTTLLIITLGSGEVEAFTHADVVRKEIARDCLLQTRFAGIDWHYVDNAGAAVHSHQKRIDALQRHQQYESKRHREGTDPATQGRLPGAARVAFHLLQA